MKIAFDLSWTPDIEKVDPRIWHHFAHHNTIAGRNFDFNDGFAPYDFPLMSELAKKLKPSYGSLDTDSDSLLNGYVKYWARDIKSNSSNSTVTEELLEKVNEYFNLIAEKDSFKEEYERLLHIIYGGDDFDLLASINGTLVKTPEQVVAEPRYKKLGELMEDLGEKINDKCSEIIQLIVNCGYEPTQECVDEYVKREKSATIKEFGLSGVGSFSIDYYRESVFNRRDAYLANVFAYPSENLPYYFMDELVFMCYVQTIVANGSNFFTGIEVGENGEGAQELIDDLKNNLNGPSSDHSFIEEFTHMDKSRENIVEWFNKYFDADKGYCWWT